MLGQADEKIIIKDDVIGSTPNWIIRWGITIIVIIFALLFAIFSLIRYPILKKSQAKLEYKYHPIPIEVPVKSLIIKLHPTSLTQMKSGDTLITLKGVSNNSIYGLTASSQGEVFWKDRWEEGSFVEQNLILGYIIPRPNERIVKFKTSVDFLTKIKEGQKIDIELDTHFGIKGNLHGYINFIKLNEISDSITINIRFPDSVNNKLSDNILTSSYSIPCSVKLSIDTISYLHYIFREVL